MDEVLKRDQNHVTVSAGVTNDADLDVIMLRTDPTTKRLLVDAEISSDTSGLATEATLLKVPGLSIPIFDYVLVAYPSATTEEYTFKSGGSGGTTVSTVTVVYTDSTKSDLSTVTKV